MVCTHNVSGHGIVCQAVHTPYIYIYIYSIYISEKPFTSK